MEYDINRPWLTLDPWQKEYIFDPNPNQDNFLLCGRQSGKTTGMSERSVELCATHFKKGEYVMINSITEKQGYLMLAKALVYAEVKYPKLIVTKGKDKPTKHIINFKNGTGILCYAAGETGEGLRGYTIKKLMCDEGSRMTEEYFIATLPMMSVIGGSMDIASTPRGKLHKDGSERYFYKCSLNPKFKKHYISAEDCPRHTKEFLEEAKKRLSKLAYAQEFLAQFTDALTTLFPKELLDKCLILQKPKTKIKGDYYLGVDIAGFGDDECTYELFERLSDGIIEQRDSIVEKRNYTTDTTKKILEIDKSYDWVKKIGIDDGGIGFGVFSELMNVLEVRRKVIPLNNSSRAVDHEGQKSKKILKEEMYFNLLTLMEQGKVRLLDDEEVRASLASMQVDEDGKVFGSNSHIAEGVDRGVWVAEKCKTLNIFARRF